MLCESCGKPAQLNYTEVVGGSKHSVALCEGCARQRGLFAGPTAPSPPAAPLPVTKVTATFSQIPLPAKPAASGPPLRCAGCGTTLASLRKSGRVGCPECYDTFREHLEPLLRRVHGEVRHRGMGHGPATDAGQRRARRTRLEGQLREAVAAEDYERAARLRDEISRLPQERSGSEPSA